MLRGRASDSCSICGTYKPHRPPSSGRLKVGVAWQLLCVGAIADLHSFTVIRPRPPRCLGRGARKRQGIPWLSHSRSYHRSLLPRSSVVPSCAPRTAATRPRDRRHGTRSPTYQRLFRAAMRSRSKCSSIDRASRRARSTEPLAPMRHARWRHSRRRTDSSRPVRPTARRGPRWAATRRGRPS